MCYLGRPEERGAEELVEGGRGGTLLGLRRLLGGPVILGGHVSGESV